MQLTGALPDLTTNMDIEGPGASQFTVRRNTGGDYGSFTVVSPAVVSIARMTITNGNGVGHGGGIYNDGTLTVTKSTISGNSAQQGGGIFSDTDLDGLTTTIINSTISGNTASTQGGGIHNHDGLTVIKYSTITNNSAPSDKGSGVSSFGDEFTSTQVLSSIISGNTNTDVDFVLDSTNSFDSEGYNLIGDGNATAAFNQSGDQSGVADPKLNALGSYGGPTQTHSLKPGSPAINAIPKATNGCGTDFATDQRGVKRPQGGKCEIGSFEDRSPWVRRVVPTEGATGVAPGTNVSAFFSEAMRASSINVNYFKLFKVGTTTPIGAKVSYDAVAKKAILNPNANLKRGTGYKAVVTTGVRDVAGNRLDQDLAPSNGNQPKVWFFRVRN